MKPMSMRAPVLFVLAGTRIAMLAASTQACDPRVVDVGRNDANVAALGTPIPEGGIEPVSKGCAEWVDEELYALRDGGCPGYCVNPPTDALGDNPYPLDSRKGIMAATAGEWLFCGNHFGPDGAVGVEFAPGCRLYFLRRDDAGTLVRGTERAFQMSYDIYHPRPAGVPARLDVHLDDERTMVFEVDANRCPERLHLVGPSKIVISMGRPGNNPDNPGNPTR